MTNDCNREEWDGEAGVDGGAGSSGASADLAALVAVSKAKTLGLIDASLVHMPLPFESKIVLYESVRVAGTAYVPDIDEIMESLSEDASLSFVREPGNCADEWAVCVEYDKRKIGYVPADVNEVVARLMDGGKTLAGTVLSCEKLDSWWKVHMEVSLID